MVNDIIVNDIVMKKFGLLGFPLGHSISAKYFTAKFENEAIDARYDKYELDSLDKFRALVSDPELCGLNVTIPYKEKVIPLLDELDETAEAIGAVNVIKITRSNGKIHSKGYNTDALGFENSLKQSIKPYHKFALILGSGGAAKAVYYVLKIFDIQPIYVSRTPKADMLTYSDLNREIIEKNLLIVNATPTGMFPNIDDCPPIPYDFITDKHLLVDVIYNPPETLFLTKGKKHGATTINGEGMWQGQANETWRIWNE